MIDLPRLWLVKRFSFRAISNQDAGSPVRASITAQTYFWRESSVAPPPPLIDCSALPQPYIHDVDRGPHELDVNAATGACPGVPRNAGRGPGWAR
jgi:hypothetical protein